MFFWNIVTFPQPVTVWTKLWNQNVKKIDLSLLPWKPFLWSVIWRKCTWQMQILNSKCCPLSFFVVIRNKHPPILSPRRNFKLTGPELKIHQFSLEIKARQPQRSFGRQHPSANFHLPGFTITGILIESENNPPGFHGPWIRQALQV